ncbi:MAG: LPD7 domain-containing protein [Pseudomonadota bacterium]
MNSIENGSPRERAPETASQVHVFARLPGRGVPDDVARHWAATDTRAVLRLSDPVEREIAFTFMALNMRDNAPYAAAIAKRAPQLPERIEQASQRNLGLAALEPGLPESTGPVPAAVGPETVQDAPRPRDKARGKVEAEEEFVLPERLRKRYLIADNKYYLRDNETTLAFEDSGKRLSTNHDDPDIAISMVELAQAKHWRSIRVKGTLDFQREVWLAAHLRGIEVTGYKPDKLDWARFAEQRPEAQERSANHIERAAQREPIPEPEAALRNEPPVASRDHLVQPGPSPATAGRSKDRHAAGHADRDAKTPLTPQQHTAVDTLKAILRARGETQRVIDTAAALAAERFTHPRVYVGKLVEHGPERYDFDDENEPSYYVKLETSTGTKTVWGVDMPRALEAGDAMPGQDIALSYQGMRWVTVNTRERDAEGKPTGRMIAAEVERNTWDVTRLDRLQDRARDRVIAASERANRPNNMAPAVGVYDKNAPRPPQSPAPMPTQERARSPKPERQPGR